VANNKIIINNDKVTNISSDNPTSVSSVDQSSLSFSGSENILSQSISSDSTTIKKKCSTPKTKVVCNQNAGKSVNLTEPLKLEVQIPATKNKLEISKIKGKTKVQIEEELSGYSIKDQGQDIACITKLEESCKKPTTGGGSSGPETDPIFTASVAAGITVGNITNWNTAFSWGNHALFGYLTSYTETDPVFIASPAFSITNTLITNWNNAFSWGDHSLAGYLTSYTETDPVFTAWLATNPLSGFLSAGDNVSLLTNDAGYITSYTETDPVFTAWLGTNPLNGYALLDATNQPFTGNLSILRGTDNQVNWGKETTANEFFIENQITPFAAGSGVSFNGNGWASRANVTLGTVYSFEFWFRSSSTASQIVFSGSSQIHFWITNTGSQIRAYHSGSFAFWGINIVNGAWRHVVVTRNGNDLTLYVDNVSQGTQNIAGGVSRSYTHIGRYANDTSHNVNGIIDEFVIWSKALSPAEVSARYNSGAGDIISNFTDVIAEYRFDNNYVDNSPNAYDLTAGGSGNTFVSGKVSAGAISPQLHKILRHYNTNEDQSIGIIDFGKVIPGSYSTINNYYSMLHTFYGRNGTLLGTLENAGIAFSVGLSGTTILTSGNITTATRFYSGIGTAALPNFSITADTNSGFGCLSSDIIYGSTAGVERFRVIANGQFGIGGSPGQQLDVINNQNGATYIRSTNNNTGVTAIAGVFSQANNANLYLFAHGSGRTATRYGVSLSNIAELATLSGATALLIGTGTQNIPIIFGTNNLERLRIHQDGYFIASAMPTSSAGLPVGAIWSDGGTLKIV